MIRMILRTVFCLFLAIALNGCKGNNDGKPLYPTTSVALSVGGGAAAPALRGPFVGTFGDVTRVTVVISGKDKFGIDQNPLAAVDLVKGAGGAWSAVALDLPIGPALTFTARGYDASDVEIFSGVTVQVLTGSGDAVNIAMNPVSTGGSVLFPVITSIAVPAEVVVSSVASIAIGVTGGTGESLNYAVTSGGGTFDPAAGTIALPSSANGTVNTNYTAPATPGALTHTVKVTNSQGNSVESDFNTTIVYSQTTFSMTVGFAPVVTAISGKRTGNQVSWTATATDDMAISLLSYAWDFNQAAGTAGAVFSTTDANPGVLSGYDQTVTGTVTLTVTDGDGLSTTITFALNAGQFPDVANGYSFGSLSGAWLVDSTADRNAGYDFFITDGNGAITSNSFYSSATPTYTVDSSGAFTLFIPQSGPSTMELTGLLTSFTTGNLSTVGLTNSTISKVSDRSLCQGAWSGSLSTGYGFVFTIKSDGMLDTAATRTISSGTIVSGAMVGQGSLCTGYFTTTLAEPYNAFRINGTLVTGPMTTLTGNFDNDSGSAWPVGTVSLTR